MSSTAEEAAAPAAKPPTNGKGAFAIKRVQFLQGPNPYASASVLVIETHFAGPVMVLLGEPPHAGLGGLQVLAGNLDGGDILARLREARAILPVGATAADLLPAICARLIDRFSVRPAVGRIVSRNDDSMVGVIPCEDDQVGIAAWDLSCRIAIALQKPADGKAETAAGLLDWQERFRAIAVARSLDQSTLALSRKALQLGIPAYWPDRSTRRYQLGQGRCRRLAVETTIQPACHFAALMARSKAATTQALRAAGLPVMPSEAVGDPEAAVAAFERIGAPAVVKPVNGKQGIGVSIGLTTPEQVRAAFRTAQRHSPQVLVEGFAPGNEHRLLVVDHCLVAAAQRTPGRLVGDGTSTLAELLAQFNADPERGAKFERLLDRVPADDRLERQFAEQGFAPGDVPGEGVEVMLSQASNIAQGGTATDFTSAIHPDNAAMAERASRIVGIGVTGIDFITPDITKSWREVGGAILEVNPTPGMRPHWIGNPEQDVVTPILRRSFPEATPSRIPTAALAGAQAAALAQRVAAIADGAGFSAGLATSEGLRIGDFAERAGDHANGAAALNLLCDPMVDLALFELQTKTIYANGLVVDDVDVSAIGALPGGEGTGAQQVAAAVLVRATRRRVLLDADDPLSAALAEEATAAGITLVTSQPDTGFVSAHRAAGGRIVSLIDGVIAFTDGDTALLSLGLDETEPDAARSLLFAAALAFELGLSAEAIADRLEG